MLDDTGVHLYLDPENPYTLAYSFDINDQLWHQVALSINVSSGSAQLYFDAVLQNFVVSVSAERISEMR